MGNCASNSSTGDAPQFSDLNEQPAKQSNKHANKQAVDADESDHLSGAAQRYVVKITSHEEEKTNNQLLSDENELSQSLYHSTQSVNQSVTQSESAPIIASVAHNRQSVPIQSQSSVTAPIKKKLDPKDFMIANRTGETVVRHSQSVTPPPVDGQSFAIEYCTESTICLLDWIAQLTIDDCSNCTFVIGPVESSIFIRNCQNCTIIVACQQIRIRDCTDCSISLLVSASQPVMESSENIKFTGYSLNFVGLKSLLSKAGLNEWDTQWSNVHDFFSQSINQSNNQADKKINYSYLPYNPGLLTDRVKHLLADQSADSSNNQFIPVGEQVVPFTWGNRPIEQSSNQSVLVLADASKPDMVWKLIQSLKLDNESIAQSISQSIDHPHKLIRTKIMQGKVLNSNQAFIKQVLNQSANQTVSQLLVGKSVIGLEFNGPDMMESLNQSINQSNLEGVVVTNANFQSIEQFFASPQI